MDRKRLSDLKEIGSGNFGIVYLAKAASIIAGAKVSNVAIKTLSEDSPEAEKSFMKEADVMKLIDGPHHIVRLLGVVTVNKPFYMVNNDPREFHRATDVYL